MTTSPYPTCPRSPLYSLYTLIPVTSEELTSPTCGARVAFNIKPSHECNTRKSSSHKSQNAVSGANVSVVTAPGLPAGANLQQTGKMTTLLHINHTYDLLNVVQNDTIDIEPNKPISLAVPNALGVTSSSALVYVLRFVTAMGRPPTVCILCNHSSRES